MLPWRPNHRTLVNLHKNSIFKASYYKYGFSFVHITVYINEKVIYQSECYKFFHQVAGRYFAVNISLDSRTEINNQESNSEITLGFRKYICSIIQRVVTCLLKK